MAVEVQDTSPQEKLLKFQIPQADVQKLLDERFHTEMSRTRARKGATEDDLKAEVEKKKGDQIRESVKLEMMDEAYEDAVLEQKISAALKPEFTNIVFDPAKDPAITFEAPVKVWPAYEITETGPCKKHLKVTICTEKIAAAIQESLEDIQENAAVKGFRRGKAPFRLVERQFGKDIRAELKNRLIAEAFDIVTKREDLSPIGDPDFKIKGEEEEKEGEKKPEEKPEEAKAEEPKANLEDEPIEFEVTLEVEPRFEVEGYKGLKLQEQSKEPTDEEMQAAIENLRLRAAELVKVEEPAKEGDAVLCNYTVTVDGKMVSEAADAELAATGANITGLPAHEAGKLLIGSKAGDEKTGKFKLTDAFPQAELRNKEAEATFTIKEVRRLNKPEANDKFAKDLGYESLDELKKDLMERLRRNKEQAVRQDLDRQVSEQLLEKFKFDLPEELVKRQAGMNAQRQQIMLLSRGVPREDVSKHAQEIRDASQSSTEREFRLYFILEKIADKERIYATEQDVEERISAMAMLRGVSPSKLNQQLDRSGAISTLRRQMREEKTMNLLIEEAEVTPAPAAKKDEQKTEETGKAKE
ncbi:MAG: trigger factor [Planctomycetota bacterium]